MNDSIIDRKFNIIAVNPVSGNLYTSANALLLCAHDKAVLPTLVEYHKQCRSLGCNVEHLQSIDLLIERVQRFQTAQYSKIPDTIGAEIPRCLHGANMGDTGKGIRILPVPVHMYERVEHFMTSLITTEANVNPMKAAGQDAVGELTEHEIRDFRFR